VYLLLTLWLVTHIPAPSYRWSEEALVRQEISQFLREDAAISRAWRDILEAGKRPGASFDDLAGRVDHVVADHYEQSFEQLADLPANPTLPSAATLATLRRYAEARRDASRAFADGLRAKDPKQMRDALDQARVAGQQLSQGGNPPPKAAAK
jgi:rhomboid protease GluP